MKWRGICTSQSQRPLISTKHHCGLPSLSYSPGWFQQLNCLLSQSTFQKHPLVEFLLSHSLTCCEWNLLAPRYPFIHSAVILSIRSWISPNTQAYIHNLLSMGSGRKSGRVPTLFRPDAPRNSKTNGSDKSDPDGNDHNQRNRDSSVRTPGRSITGADKDETDDEVRLLYNSPTAQEVWLLVSEVPPKAVKEWMQGHRDFPKSVGDKVPPFIHDLVRGDDNEIWTTFRKGGKERNGELRPFVVVQATTVPFDLLEEYAKRQRVVLGTARGPGGKDIITLSPVGWEIVLARQDGDESIPPVRPDSESVSNTPSSEAKGHAYMLAHKNNVVPHYPIPTTIKGRCDDATKSFENITHNDDIARCQSGKHKASNPHYVCTDCHHKDPAYNLTKHERNHMIRDKGLFPLCTKCVEHISEHWNIEIEEDQELDNCTCLIGLPQWLCVDCWVELARLRSNKRGEGDRCRCNGRTGGKSNKWDYEISDTVRQCSGCDELVIRKW